MFEYPVECENCDTVLGTRSVSEEKPPGHVFKQNLCVPCSEALAAEGGEV